MRILPQVELVNDTTLYCTDTCSGISVPNGLSELSLRWNPLIRPFYAFLPGLL